MLFAEYLESPRTLDLPLRPVISGQSPVTFDWRVHSMSDFGREAFADLMDEEIGVLKDRTVVLVHPTGHLTELLMTFLDLFGEWSRGVSSNPLSDPDSPRCVFQSRCRI